MFGQTFVPGNAPVLIPYPVTWTADGGGNSLGNGTLNGAYSLIGPKLLLATITLAFGSTTIAGTGIYRWSLPTGFVPNPTYASTGPGAVGHPAANNFYVIGVLYAGGGKVIGFTSTGAIVTATVPIAPVSGDSYVLSLLTYL